MPTAHDGPDGKYITHLRISHTVDLASIVWRCSLLNVVTPGRSMAGLEPLAVAKFSGILGTRTCNRHHDPLYKNGFN